MGNRRLSNSTVQAPLTFDLALRFHSKQVPIDFKLSTLLSSIGKVESPLLEFTTALFISLWQWLERKSALGEYGIFPGKDTSALGSISFHDRVQRPAIDMN